MAAASAAVDFAAVAVFMAVAFAAAGFAAVDFTEIGFIMATSTIGFSSLTALETHSFTIPIHITAITHMATILTATDTVVFGAAALATLVLAVMAFMAVVFTAV